MVLAVLATWRMTHLLAREDGPGDLIFRVRAWLGQGVAAKLMDCFYCLSLWIAAPAALFVSRRAIEWIFTWLALSGALVCWNVSERSRWSLNGPRIRQREKSTMCCGQKRSQLQSSPAPAGTRSVPQRASVSSHPRGGLGQSPGSAGQQLQIASPIPVGEKQIRTIEAQAAGRTSTPQIYIGVRYLANSPVRVCGAISGVSYEFSGSAPIQRVDARDASALLSTRFFRRI